MSLAAAIDDVVSPFQIENQPVRGRIVRLGGVVDEILSRHDYPPAVANLLGEACALASLVGASLKFNGRLILQAQGKEDEADAIMLALPYNERFEHPSLVAERQLECDSPT